MTYRIPKKTLTDKLLSLIGKQRAIYLPPDVYKRFGPYVIVQPQIESIWRALFRPKKQEPPEGWFYPLE
jgi:hypothetical protein